MAVYISLELHSRDMKKPCFWGLAALGAVCVSAVAWYKNQLKKEKPIRSKKIMFKTPVASCDVGTQTDAPMCIEKQGSTDSAVESENKNFYIRKTIETMTKEDDFELIPPIAVFGKQIEEKIFVRSESHEHIREECNQLLNKLIKNEIEKTHREIVEVPHTFKIKEALKILLSDNIRCCTVFQRMEGRSKKLLGFLNVWTANRYLVEQNFGKHQPRVCEALAEAVTCDVNQSMKHLVSKMCSGGHYHVGLKNEHGRLYQIVSQGDVVGFLSKHLSVPSKSFTMMELGLPRGDVDCISDSCTAAEAFRVMVEKKRSSLPIVSEETRSLVDVVSASDIRVLGSLSEDADIVHQLLSFKASKFSHRSRDHVRGHYRNEFSDRVPVTCTEQTTLGEMFDKIFKHHVHQIYVVNDLKQPIGVISLIDLIRSLC